MILYIHKKTVTYRDYGDFLERDEGVAYSFDNDPQHAMCFERGSFEKSYAKKQEDMREFPVEIRRGVDIETSCDLNPHGLM